MNQEEILIKMGIDNGTFSKGLSSAKTQLSDWVANVRGSIGGKITGIFSVGAVIAELGHVGEVVKKIQADSNALGVSTGFIQDLQNVGKTANVSGDQIEEMFKKFEKGLPAGSDVEQSFYQLADQLNNIQDPAERARLAMEKFGKAGLDMLKITEGGAAGIKKMAAEFQKFSDSDIKAIEEGNRQIESVENTLTIAAGKAISGIGLIAQAYGRLSADPGRYIKFFGMQGFLQAMTDSMAGDEEDADKKSIATKKAEAIAAQAEITSASDTALKKYQTHLDDIKLKSGTTAEKLHVLNKRMAEAQKIDLTQGKGTPEYYEKLTQIADIENEIAEVKKQSAKEEEEAGQKRKDADEKRKELIGEIADTERKITLEKSKMQAEQLRPYESTLDEIAKSGQWRRAFNGQQYFQQGPYAQDAQQILKLTADAKEARMFGNTDRVTADDTRIKELRKTMSDAGVISPDETFASMNEHLKESETHLAELVSKSNGEGIHIQPVNGQ